MNRNLKILFGLLLFVVLYLEPLQLGPVKLSHLWKIGTIFLLLIMILFRLSRERSKIQLPHCIFIGYLYAGWPLVSACFISSPFQSVVISFQRLFFVMMLHYLSLRKLSPAYLKEFTVSIVAFVVLSIIPFQLHLLQPLGTVYDVVYLLGASENGFVGIFPNPHIASLTLAFALTIAMVDFLVDGRNKAMSIAVCSFLGLILLKTYARSGLVAFVAGITCYLTCSRRVKVAVRLSVVALCALAALSLTSFDFGTVKDRMLGKTMYTEQSHDMNSVSSGRITFWLSALDTYAKSSSVHWVTGIGEQALMDEMEKKVGLRIFAHNGFINELVCNGVIGLLLLALFIRAVISDVGMIAEAASRHMGYSVVAVWVTFVFFQGGEFPLQYVFLFPFVMLSTASAYYTQYVCNPALRQRETDPTSSMQDVSGTW